MRCLSLLVSASIIVGCVGLECYEGKNGEKKVVDCYWDAHIVHFLKPGYNSTRAEELLEFEWVCFKHVNVS